MSENVNTLVKKLKRRKRHNGRLWGTDLRL